MSRRTQKRIPSELPENVIVILDRPVYVGPLKRMPIASLIAWNAWVWSVAVLAWVYVFRFGG